MSQYGAIDVVLKAIIRIAQQYLPLLKIKNESSRAAVVLSLMPLCTYLFFGMTAIDYYGPTAGQQRQRVYTVQ